jgi:inorganic pyrophosphatase
MPNFMNLPPFTENGDVHVVVETPRGSRAKFAYDPKLETFILSKSLLTGLTYPHDWASCHRPKPMTAIRSTSW